MSALTLPHFVAPPLPARPNFSPRAKSWTVDEFHALWKLPEYETVRMVLIRGEIFEMPNPNPPHDMATTLALYLLQSIFGAGFTVRAQMGLVLGLTTDPMPDIAVIVGSPRDYISHPTMAVLVVEVAKSSLDFDLGLKASLYASAGMADYWVVDVNGRQVIVHRDPVADSAQPFGAGYARVSANDAGQSISPLAVPLAAVAVGDLLP